MRCGLSVYLSGFYACRERAPSRCRNFSFLEPAALSPMQNTVEIDEESLKVSASA